MSNHPALTLFDLGRVLVFNDPSVRPVLVEMEADADADVRFYAAQSLQMCDNKMRS